MECLAFKGIAIKTNALEMRMRVCNNDCFSKYYKFHINSIIL